MTDAFAKATEAVERYCERRIPERLRDQIRVESATRGDSITIFECHPPWRVEDDEWSRVPVAQFRLETATAKWSLYCRLACGRWRRFDPAPEADRIEKVIAEVEADPTGIFWG